MGFLQAFRAEAGSGRPALSEHDDFWYHPAGWVTDSGIRLSPAAAQSLAAVWCGVNVYAKGVAMLPCHVYERLPRGKERVPGHPLYDVLRWQPNALQTAYEFWEMATGHVVVRGNFYAQIMPGPRGFADQLIPLHPDRMRVAQLPSGRPLYAYTPASGQPKTYTQEQIFHLRGPGGNGLTGESFLSYGANSLGGMLAVQSYQRKFFKQGITAAIAVTHPNELGKTGRENLRASINEYAAGLENAFGVLLLEENLSLEKIGISPQDAQLIDATNAGVEDVARWLDLPLHRLKVNKPGAVSYNSVEIANLEYLISSLQPMLIRFEQAIQRDLVLAKDRYFIEFNMEGQLRGDAKSRADFYWKMWQMGAYSINDILELENRNPVPGGDRRFVPANMVPVEEAGQRVPRTVVSAETDDLKALVAVADAPPRARAAARPRDTRAALIITEAAERLVRKEIAAIRKAAERFSADATGWQAWLRTFYADHAGLVAYTLALPPEVAREYVSRHGLELERTGVAATAEWEWREASSLAALVLQQDEPAA